MSEHWQIAALDAASSRISALIGDVDLTTPVGHLKRWRVRDVVAHLGGVHEWAIRIITTRSIAGPGFKKSKRDGPELCEWFDAGSAALTNQFRSLDPADSCPNFNPGSDNTIEWWIRRQAHESTVHRWDIEAALGCATPIPAKLAADGIDEFLDVFVRTRGKQTLRSALVIQTTRPMQGWTLTPASKPGRIDVASTSSSPTPQNDITQVIGTPESLLLALWGRVSATDANLTITGDPTVAANLLTL